MKKPLLAGFVGGTLAVVVLAAIAVRLMPRLMPKMMERMMADGNCPDAMRKCMDRCGCGTSKADPED